MEEALGGSLDRHIHMEKVRKTRKKIPLSLEPESSIARTCYGVCTLHNRA